MHETLRQSGLMKKYQISSDINHNDPRAKFLNQRVRYKSHLQEDPGYIYQHGTCIVNGTFIIKEFQVDWQGGPMLRGYDENRKDVFGRVINPEDVEIIA